jgi:hypothetical protein
VATSDRDDIVDLTVRYAQAIDEKDETLLAQCVAPSVRATGSGPGPMGSGLAGGMLGGGGAVPGPVFASTLVGGLRRMGATQHLFANHQVTWRDDDHATVKFSMRAMHFAVGRATSDPYEVGGYYEHDLVRTGGGWRIEFWRLNLLWEHGDSSVLAGSADEP